MKQDVMLLAQRCKTHIILKPHKDSKKFKAIVYADMEAKNIVRNPRFATIKVKNLDECRFLCFSKILEKMNIAHGYFIEDKFPIDVFVTVSDINLVLKEDI